MKTIYSIVFAMLICSISYGQQKMVILEEFTNASCPPCEVQNPAFDALMEANHGKVIGLRYHTAFPGYDPMNEHNPDEVLTRRNYYGITGVPTASMVGLVPGPSYGGGVGTWNSDGSYNGGPYGYNQAVLDYAYGELSADLILTVDATYTMANDTVLLTIVVSNEGAVDYVSGGDVLHTVLAEEEISFLAPPGSTNEKDFALVVKKMIPNVDGTPMVDIMAGTSHTFEMTVNLPNYYYDKTLLNAVTFIQNVASKTIRQGAISELAEFNGDQIDLEATTNATAAAPICGQSEISPILTITNTGANMATGFDVTLVNAGGTVDIQTFIDTLMPGQTADISFANLALGYGNYPYGYFIQSNQDINGVNDQLIASALSIGDVSSDYNLNQGFEGLAINELPTTQFVLENSQNNPILVIDRNDFGTPPANPIGGFQQSEDILFVQFYNMATGASNSIYFDQMDLTDYNVGAFKFSLAYAQYTTENDRLEVLASTDCGATWNSLFNEAGASLATRPALGSGQFFPLLISDWDSISVDLTDYVGMNNVILRIRTTSAFGNNLFLDDIRVEKDFNSGVGELDEVSEFLLSPNPAHDELNVNLSLTSNISSASINLMDISGSLVKQVFNGPLSAQNQFKVDVSNLASGMYFMQVSSDEGISNRKFVVN